MGQKPTVNQGLVCTHLSMIPNILSGLQYAQDTKGHEAREKTIDLMDNMNPNSTEKRDLCYLFKATDKILLSRPLRKMHTDWTSTIPADNNGNKRSRNTCSPLRAPERTPL